MTPAERQRLRELCEKATPGPWEVHNGPSGLDDVTANATDPKHGSRFYVCEAGYWRDANGEGYDSPDMAFIAAARTAVPALLDEVERLERAIVDAPHAHDCPDHLRPPGVYVIAGRADGVTTGRFRTDAKGGLCTCWKVDAERGRK